MSSNLSLIELIESQSKKYKQMQKQMNPQFSEFSLNIDTKALADCSQMLHQAVNSANNSSSSSISSESLGSSLQQFQLHNYDMASLANNKSVNEGYHRKNQKSMKVTIGRMGKHSSKNSDTIATFMGDNNDASTAAATASRFAIYSLLCNPFIQ